MTGDNFCSMGAARARSRELVPSVQYDVLKKRSGATREAGIVGKRRVRKVEVVFSEGYGRGHRPSIKSLIAILNTVHLIYSYTTNFGTRIEEHYRTNFRTLYQLRWQQRVCFTTNWFTAPPSFLQLHHFC